jgi:hypothetical protein
MAINVRRILFRLTRVMAHPVATRTLGRTFAV